MYFGGSSNGFILFNFRIKLVRKIKKRSLKLFAWLNESVVWGQSVFFFGGRAGQKFESDGRFPLENGWITKRKTRLKAGKLF